MGYGLPTAMGVAAGNPGRLVVNIDGDGSFVMNSQELATCYESRLAVKTVILNNGGHGMVRQWQEIIYGGPLFAVEPSPSPHLPELARPHGGGGLRPAQAARGRPARGEASSAPG